MLHMQATACESMCWALADSATVCIFWYGELFMSGVSDSQKLHIAGDARLNNTCKATQQLLETGGGLMQSLQGYQLQQMCGLYWISGQ